MHMRILLVSSSSKQLSDISLFISLCVSVESWDMTEGEMEVRDWPDLLSDAPVMGGAGCAPGLPRLKRGQGSRHLGVDMAFNADNELGGERSKHFTSSGNSSTPAQPVQHPQSRHTKCLVLLKTKVMLSPPPQTRI